MSIRLCTLQCHIRSVSMPCCHIQGGLVTCDTELPSYVCLGAHRCSHQQIYLVVVYGILWLKHSQLEPRIIKSLRLASHEHILLQCQCAPAHTRGLQLKVCMHMYGPAKGQCQVSCRGQWLGSMAGLNAYLQRLMKGVTGVDGSQCQA